MEARSVLALNAMCPNMNVAPVQQATVDILKTCCQCHHFKPNWTVAPFDTTQTIWRHVLFVLFFLMFEYTATMGFHCVGSGPSPPWNCRSVKRIKKCSPQPPSTFWWEGNGWNFNFEMNPFNAQHIHSAFPSVSLLRDIICTFPWPYKHASKYTDLISSLPTIPRERENAACWIFPFALMHVSQTLQPAENAISVSFHC